MIGIEKHYKNDTPRHYQSWENYNIKLIDHAIC